MTQTELGWLGRDALCLILCNVFGAKTVVHLHGGHLRLNFSTFSAAGRKIVKWACRSVRAGLVLSPGLSDQLEFLLRNGVVSAPGQPIDTALYGNDDLDDYDPLLVLFMGHLTQAKGYCDLVRCIPQVAAKFPEVRFLFAGTMYAGERGVFYNQATGQKLRYEDPYDIHAMASSGKHAKNYSYAGMVSGQLKLSLLRRCSIFVSSSYSEGLSLSLLEAMCMGKPVICTSVGAHPEIVEDGINGYVVGPGDVEALAKCITTLLSDPALRRKFGMENYAYVRKYHDVSVVAPRFSRAILGVAK